MSAEAIRALCRELAAEADAVVKYTDDIEATESLESGPADLFREIRLDELEHIQKLTLALTEQLTIAEEDAGGDEDAEKPA